MFRRDGKRLIKVRELKRRNRSHEISKPRFDFCWLRPPEKFVRSICTSAFCVAQAGSQGGASFSTQHQFPQRLEANRPALPVRSVPERPASLRVLTVKALYLADICHFSGSLLITRCHLFFFVLSFFQNANMQARTRSTTSTPAALPRCIDSSPASLVVLEVALLKALGLVSDSQALLLCLVSDSVWADSGSLIKTGGGSACTAMADDNRKEEAVVSPAHPQSRAQL